MIIDKNSWHYKFIKFGRDKSIPGNLCNYIRTLICKLIIFSFVSCFVLFITYALGENNLKFIFEITSNSMFVQNTSSLIFGLMCLGAGVLSWVLGILIVAVVLSLLAMIDKVKECIGEKLSKPKPKSKQNVFLEYLKSKNENVCKQIVFVDKKVESNAK